MGNSDNYKGDEQGQLTITASACDQCRSRKIRCDRKSPDCSNCTKAGVSCDFSNKGRRINHTKQLVNDFTGLTTRLQTIDESIASLSRQMTAWRADFTTRSDITSPSPKTRELCSRPDSEDLESFHTQLATKSGLETNEADQVNSKTGMHCVEDTQSGEHFYGFTAPITLFRSSRQLLSDVLTPIKRNSVPGDASKRLKNTIKDDHGDENDFTVSQLVARDVPLGAALQLQYEAFPFQGASREPDFHGDGNTIARPPLALLEASIDCFFQEINSSIPIFQKARLKAAMKEQYHTGAASAVADMSWSLCFNNIILLTLGLKSRLARFGRPQVDGMDDDLLVSFLKNSRRAFQSLEYFSKPRLVNAQALITLTQANLGPAPQAMVAREYFEGHVFDKLCSMACQLIRLMGLQQSHSVSLTPSDLDTERRNIFWALYLMDKQRVFMNGRPCDLYLFDSDIQLPIRDDASALQRYNLAHIHMMTLWEEVYMSLYSSRALRKGNLQRQEQVCRLQGLVRRWTAQHNDLINTSEEDSSSVTTFTRLELMYCFHVIQILMYRSRCQDSSSEQQWRTSAQAALKIISDLRSADPTLGRAALLGRLFRNYPMVAFHDIHDRFITAADMSIISDVALLVDTAELLSILKNPAFPQVYYTRLHLGLAWSIENVQAIKKALDFGVRQTADDPSEPYAHPKEPQELSRPVATDRERLNLGSSDPMTTSPQRKRRPTSPAVLDLEEDGIARRAPHRPTPRPDAPRVSDFDRIFKPHVGVTTATGQSRNFYPSSDDNTSSSFLPPSIPSVPTSGMSAFGRDSPQSANTLVSNVPHYGSIAYGSSSAIGTSNGSFQNESNPTVGSFMLDNWDMNNNDQMVLDDFLFHSSI